MQKQKRRYAPETQLDNAGKTVLDIGMATIEVGIGLGLVGAVGKIL